MFSHSTRAPNQYVISVTLYQLHQYQRYKWNKVLVLKPREEHVCANKSKLSINSFQYRCTSTLTFDTSVDIDGKFSLFDWVRFLSIIYDQKSIDNIFKVWEWYNNENWYVALITIKIQIVKQKNSLYHDVTKRREQNDAHYAFHLVLEL